MKKQNNANTITIVAAIAAIAVVAVVAYAIGQSNGAYGYGMMNRQYASGMMGSGMMSGKNSMMNSGMHDADDIEWMRNEMKEYMNFSDEQINSMIESCPMMKASR